jgi:hypothetical protein
MTITAEPATQATTCPSWCVGHNDYSDETDTGTRIEHKSETFPWSRKRRHFVELLQFDNDRPGLHLTAGDHGENELDAEKVTSDELLNLMRQLAKIIVLMETGR